MVFQVLDDNGSPIDAHFDLDGPDIVFHSRGGSKGQSDAINSDYSPGLRLLLARIMASPVQIERAWVDSSRVQAIPLEQRMILRSADVSNDVAEVVRLLSSRMKNIGRVVEASGGGNSTKRIRIRLSENRPPEEVLTILRGRAVNKDIRGLDRLPAEELRKVSPEHVWNAVQKLVAGFSDHQFRESTKFDLIVDGNKRLDPKAVFGIAATEALGFEVLPRHFSAGDGTVCFSILEEAGFEIVLKGNPSTLDAPPVSAEDRDWTEGRVKLIQHLKRERAAGLSKAKKTSFVREYGKLFCEKCGMDPIAVYGGPYGDACIEVHHSETHVEDMSEGHRTRLADLMCLCANCHRVVHRLLKEEG